jgi:diguanylate cyclase (GGDEF)-like protein
MQQPLRKIPGVHVETVATARHSRRDLAQVGLLKGAHQERIMPLLRHCPVLLLASGEILLRNGETCEAIYLVLSGRLRLQDPSAKAADVLVDAGDSIGELVLLQKAVMTGTVSAVEPSRVVVVDRKTAWKLVGVSHEISQNWLALLSARTRAEGTMGVSAALLTTHGGHPTLDEVSGLYNRQWLESMLPRQMTRSASSNEALALLLIEIDGFDDYAKRFGPAAGDHACKAVAQTVADNLRPTDLVVAYGRAQFGVVLVATDGASACQVGERLRHAVSSDPTVSSAERDSPALTISVGATEFRAATDLSAFLEAAETALKMAKVSGGNRVGMQPIGD